MSESAKALDLLDGLLVALERLVTDLEGGASSDARELEGVWSSCAEAFAAVRGELDPASPLSAAASEKVKQALRLQAVASGLASHQRDEIASEMESLSGVRGRVRAMRRDSAGGVGRSCDVSG